MQYVDNREGQPYEFIAYIPGKHREALGEKLTFGQLPLYEEDDLILAQSGAIMRYLAKKHGNLRTLIYLLFDFIDRSFRLVRVFCV